MLTSFLRLDSGHRDTGTGHGSWLLQAGRNKMPVLSSNWMGLDPVLVLALSSSVSQMPFAGFNEQRTKASKA